MLTGGGRMQLFARTVLFKDGLSFGREQLLNSVRFFNTGNGYRTYDVSPDGKRFLMIVPVNETVSRTANPHCLKLV
jgi:hypothetical protein